MERSIADVRGELKWVYNGCDRICASLEYRRERGRALERWRLRAGRQFADDRNCCRAIYRAASLYSGAGIEVLMAKISPRVLAAFIAVASVSSVRGDQKKLTMDQRVE